MELGGDLPAALALVRSGALPSEDLIDVATDALMDGLDSPSLRELAGIRKEDAPWTGRELAERALTELGLTISEDASARRLLARAIAREILTGAESEFVGSRRLWGLFSGNGHYPDFAGELIGIEDEWEGGWGRTERELRARVRVVAAELLDAWGDPTSRSSRIHSQVRHWLEAEFERWAADHAALQGLTSGGSRTRTACGDTPTRHSLAFPAISLPRPCSARSSDCVLHDTILSRCAQQSARVWAPNPWSTGCTTRLLLRS